ncbi:MAG: DUF418 domain-containing protein [Streptosporangiales bacterium]|nr:DUF418 domain-containing protein [Streptosporangiales bacterium]
MHALDALRGFALCGIIFVNIPQTMEMLPSVAVAPDGLRLFVLGRFYPIFFLLFGISFGIFLSRAALRTDQPRILLLRRLFALAVIGIFHHLLQPGEVLLPFAVVGLVVLVPLSFAPTRVNLVVGIVLTGVGLFAGVGGFGILPGLFVLGHALAELSVPETLARRTRQLAVLVVICALVSVAVFAAIEWGVSEQVGRRIGLLFSLSMSLGYACLFLLLLRTPVGPALSSMLAPLGRMALTNYLTATVLFVVLGNAIGLRGTDDFATAGLLGAAILVVQAVWSPLWMRHFRYGPFEWVWRCVTWWQLVPMRRSSTPEEQAPPAPR